MRGVSTWAVAVRKPTDEQRAEGRDLQPVAGGELLGRRLADGDRPRRHAAHHHALEDGLAAHRRIALSDERPVLQALGRLGAHV